MFQRRPPNILIACACLAAGIIVTRAARQSITIDEADSYLIWATSQEPWHWEGNSNNHILNSALMRLSTNLFGTSPFTTRLPALLGSMLYIGTAVQMVTLLAPNIAVQVSLFVCLVFNPFLLDYLVAARGYSLALGFLMMALVLLVRHHLHDDTRRCPPRLASIGACLALAMAANFSFALVCAATFVFAAMEMLLYQPTGRLRLVLLGATPGALITMFLTSYGLLRFHRSDLSYGAKSLSQFAGSMVTPSFHEPNRYLVNPLLLPVFQHAKPVLLAALAVSVSVLVIAAIRRDRSVLALSATFVFIASAAFATHYLMFRAMRVPLPEGRTGIYFVPLTMLALGAALRRHGIHRAVRHAQAATGLAMALIAVHHLSCLRLDYFYEWRYNAAVDKAWLVAGSYAHKHGVKTVASRWMYISALRYYRSASKETGFDIVEAARAGTGPHIFAVHYLFEQDIIQKYGLQVVYRDEGNSDMAIAVSPELAGLCSPT
ncbi:MAG: hypothetical protein HY820_41450 [Acidobacteria bacterium]|nr:hypothetical protein [Acidobacteriota bacterium]